MLASLLRDFLALARLCGFRVALKWLLCVVKTLPQCVRSRSLMPADKAMGPGPFTVRGAVVGSAQDPAQSASVVFSGIREIWARNVYRMFTALVLARSPSAGVLAVEPSRLLNQSFSKMIAANGWESRVSLVPAFVGSLSPVQKRVLAEDKHYTGIPFVNPDDLVAETATIDFLKCDIEGSEFGLIESSIFAKSVTNSCRGSRFLRRSQPIH